MRLIVQCILTLADAICLRVEKGTGEDCVGPDDTLDTNFFRPRNDEDPVVGNVLKILPLT